MKRRIHLTLKLPNIGPVEALIDVIAPARVCEEITRNLITLTDDLTNLKIIHQRDTLEKELPEPEAV